MTARLGLVLGVLAAAVLMVVSTTACMSGTDEEAVQRKALVQAFAEAGEPLELGLDMAKVDPESPVDAIYTPKEDSRPRVEGFEVSLFDNHDAAVEQRVPPDVDVEVRKNIFVIFSPKTPALRRQRVVAILESL